MAKTLQQIKDEIANKYFGVSWSSCDKYDYITDNMIDEVAVIYAQEQNKELLEMLETINEGINTMEFTQLEGLHNEIVSLITKHKQS